MGLGPGLTHSIVFFYFIPDTKLSVFCHASDEDRKPAVHELVELPTMRFELVDEIFVVHVLAIKNKSLYLQCLPFALAALVKTRVSGGFSEAPDFFYTS